MDGQAHLEPELAANAARGELISQHGSLEAGWRKYNDVRVLMQAIRDMSLVVSHDRELRRFALWCCEWAQAHSNDSHKAHDASEAAEAYLRDEIDLATLNRRCQLVVIPEVRNRREQRRQSLFLAWHVLGQYDGWRSADDCSAHARDFRLGGNGRNKPNKAQADALRDRLGVNPFAAAGPTDSTLF